MNALISGKSVDGKTIPVQIDESGRLIVSNETGFQIPPYDSQEFTYYGSTNNIETQVFKLGETTVATLTFTYVGSGAANNDRLSSITKA